MPPLSIKTLTPWISARLFSNLAKQMLTVVIAWHVYELTRDPLALGLIGLAEALPYVTASMWFGALVDRREKRRYMLFAEGSLLVGATTLLIIATVSSTSLPVLYGAIAWIGLSRSIGHAAASSYIQTIIPRDRFPRVAAWNLLQYQTALIGGPLLGGWVLSTSGIKLGIAVPVFLWAGSLCLTALLRRLPPDPRAKSGESTWQQMMEGLRFIRSQPMIHGPMALDMVAVLIGDAIALYPIFADRMGTGALGLGVLRAATSAGAALLSAAQSLRPFVRPSWRLLKSAIVIFALCIIGFAFSTHVVPATVFLLLAGAADGMSVIIRQSLYQGLTPDHLRGRVTSVNGIFITASNEIGAFESGLAARLFGLIPSVVGGAILTLGSVGVASKIFGDLDRRREEKTS